jgi:hypothetical protein
VSCGSVGSGHEPMPEIARKEHWLGTSPSICFLTNRCDSSVTMKGDGVKVWRQPALYAKCSQVSTPNN